MEVGVDTIQATILPVLQTAQSTVQSCCLTIRVTNCSSFPCMTDFLKVGLLVLKQRKVHPRETGNVGYPITEQRARVTNIPILEAWKSLKDVKAPESKHL